jgi:hypothetical protein
MNPIAFTLRFEGAAVEVDEGRFWMETRADATVPDAAHGQVGPIDGGGALCRRNLELWADGSLVQSGQITFGADDAITFRARGALGVGPYPGLRHGTAVLEVTGGRGRLAGARGFVTSNFLLSDTGELIDHHLGLLFVDQADQQRRRR